MLTTTAVAQSTAPAQPTLLAPLLDESHALEAQRLVERWLQAGAVEPPENLSLPVTDLMGVRVTLRMNGFTVGVGSAYRSDVSAVVDAPGPPTDLVTLVAEAARSAFGQLRGQLRQAQVRAAGDGLPDADTSPPTLAQVADQILVGVQLARRLESIHLPASADPGAIYGTFAPGFHGLRVPPRDVEAAGVGQVIWPASALASNISPHSQLVQLLNGAGYARGDIARLARPEGPPLQRFRVIHVVRSARALPPLSLVRGNVLLPPLAVDTRTLDSLADQLALHLSGRFTDGRVRGTYHPTQSRYDPRFAPPEQAALACYAVARHARLALQRHPHAPAAIEMAQMALDTALALARRGSDAGAANEQSQRGESLDAVTTAWIILTLVDSPLPIGDDARLRDALGRQLIARQTKSGGFRSGATADADLLNPPRQAVVTAALAALYEQTRSPRVGQAVRAALDYLWGISGGNPDVAVLPWYTLAHHRAARLLAAGDEAALARIAQRERVLGKLADRLGRQQVIEPPLLGPADVIGGFELRQGPPGSPPNPDWRTAWLLSFLSTCLTDEHIAQGHNRFDWVLTAGLAARFVGQLMMGRPSCYYVGNAAGALHGVRLALWDNRLSVPASAISLLAVTQLREATARMDPPTLAPPDATDSGDPN